MLQLAFENGPKGDGIAACFASQLAESSSAEPHVWCPHDSVVGAVRGGKSGPEARQILDNENFWKSRGGRLEDAGMYPNVCHFDKSDWVWRNTLDNTSAHEMALSCKGSANTPQVYGDDIGDFMSIDSPGTIAVDIAGAQYGGGQGSASGETYSTQDESTPVFYPETVALGFNSKNRSISTGTTSLIFLGVRHYFSGQSGSHGYDFAGLQRPLFDHGNSCGKLRFAKLLRPSRMLNDSISTIIGGDGGWQTPSAQVRMYRHSVSVLTSSCGTCADGNLPSTNFKFRTAGATCLVQWTNGRSGCGNVPEGGWTYWMDVWIWVGAFRPEFYPLASRQAFQDVVSRIGSGPWGAGVWWGNTLQYFVVAWLATGLLWDGLRLGPQLDYYAYGTTTRTPPLGGFCEQYQAQGYEDAVRWLPQISAALQAKQMRSATTFRELYTWLRQCSRCKQNCTFPGIGPPPADVYCASSCTDDFLSCLINAITDGDAIII
jgi:hypothetical protein